MNAEKIISFGRHIGAYLIIVGSVCAGLNSCKTRPPVVATDESIIGSQVSAARIEAVNAGLRDILYFHDIAITAEIGHSIRGIDDALAALEQYDAFVQELVRRVRELEYTTRSMETEEPDKDYFAPGGFNPLLD